MRHLMECNNWFIVNDDLLFFSKCYLAYDNATLNVSFWFFDLLQCCPNCIFGSLIRHLMWCKNWFNCKWGLIPIPSQLLQCGSDCILLVLWWERHLMWWKDWFIVNGDFSYANAALITYLWCFDLFYE